MKKVHRYSRFNYLGLLLVGYLFFILAKGFLYEAFPIESYTYSIVLFVLVILLIASFIQYWRDTAVKIVTDPNSIEIRKPFQTVKLSWEEISEFGKYRKVAPYLGGFWVYYIRGGRRHKRTVLVSIYRNHIMFAHDLCHRQIEYLSKSIDLDRKDSAKRYHKSSIVNLQFSIPACPG